MKFEIICPYCNKKPSEIEEYVEAAESEGTTPDEFVKTGEGTYNKDNGHFCCTDCYIAIGMPATEPGAEHGWVAP